MKNIIHVMSENYGDINESLLEVYWLHRTLRLAETEN